MSKKIDNGSFCYGIEKLRSMVAMLNNNSESFNQNYSIEELCQLHNMALKCLWDYRLDQWSKRQIAEALQGIVPQWDDNEQPLYQD